MGIDLAHYHGWHGRRRWSGWSCVAIVRVALIQVFRRRLYWFALGLGLLNFVLHWSIIYAVTQLKLDDHAQSQLFRAFGFVARSTAGQENGYVLFMERQSAVVMLLLAFAGSLLVGADFRHGSLPFYLSRRIDRVHYIAGKILAVAAIVALLTVVPALALFVEYGLFTSSLDYWISQRHIVAAILGYGLVLCTVLSVVLVALSAWLQRTTPIAITWASLFVLTATLSRLLREATDNHRWALLDPWRNMRVVGRMAFDSVRREADLVLVPWSLAILGGLCLVSLAVLIRRVRAVEIVE